MRKRRLTVALSLVVVPTLASAQAPTSADSVPRAGEWGAEVAVSPSTTGASLLRFHSPRLAMVFGADFNLARSKSETGNPPFDGSASYTYGHVIARLGVRGYRQTSTERLRPVAGFGVRGGYIHPFSDTNAWTAGVYGELGAVYFLVPHVSLGGIGGIEANYTKQKRNGGTDNSTEASTSSISGSLVHVLLSVYF